MQTDGSRILPVQNRPSADAHEFYEAVIGVYLFGAEGLVMQDNKSISDEVNPVIDQTTLPLSTFGRIKKLFSKDFVTAAEVGSYIRTSVSCFFATLLQMVAVGIVYVVNKGELQDKGTSHNIEYSEFKFALLVVFFMIFIWAPMFFAKRETLQYRTANLCAILSFAIPSYVIAFLVKWSGGMTSSIYSTAFVSLYGISLFIPRDIEMKGVLFSVIFLLNIWIILTREGPNRANISILCLSLLAYIAGVVIKAQVDVLQEWH